MSRHPLDKFADDLILRQDISTKGLDPESCDTDKSHSENSNLKHIQSERPMEGNPCEMWLKIRNDSQNCRE